jgi:hypothetical protein
MYQLVSKKSICLFLSFWVLMVFCFCDKRGRAVHLHGVVIGCNIGNHRQSCARASFDRVGQTLSVYHDARDWQLFASSVDADLRSDLSTLNSHSRDQACKDAMMVGRHSDPQRQHCGCGAALVCHT